MSEKLGGIEIDPSKLSINDLKKLGLTEGSSLDIIRTISDIAIREDKVR